jgi:RNA polymerase sigma-70 factor (ECF subfamily)
MTLNEVYDRHGEEMYHFLALRLGSPQDAEDVLQETFCRLARYGPRWAFVRNPRAFVFRVLRNEVHRFLGRSLKRRDGERRRFEEQAGAPEARVRGSADLGPAAVEAALSRLPDEQKEVVILKVFQDFSFKEIAAICRLSPNTAASRYRYGLQKLQSLMEGKND